jgi:hypothetical protein
MLQRAVLSFANPEQQPAWMAAHAQDDAGPAAGHECRADAERNDEGAVAGEGPAISGEVAAADRDRQDPETEARDEPDQCNQARERGVPQAARHALGYPPPGKT